MYIGHGWPCFITLFQLYSRFIWYFPEPKFSSLADLLSPDPIDQEVFESALGKFQHNNKDSRIIAPGKLP